MSSKYIQIDDDDDDGYAKLLVDTQKDEVEKEKDDDHSRLVDVKPKASEIITTSTGTAVVTEKKDMIKTDDSHSNSTTEKRPFTIEEFTSMWENVEQVDFGYKLQDIESSSFVRQSNQKAMYGRITSHALSKIFTLFDLKPNDTFLDLGHGLGLPSIQAAYTIGCDAKGIELEQVRYALSEQFRDCMEMQRDKIRQRNIKHEDNHLVGNIDFRCGDLTSPEHLEYITSANKIFVNNAQEIFASRCNQTFPNGRMLDDYVASIFARLQPGSIMITCQRLTSLGRSITEENDYRVKIGLEPNPSASFFEYDGNVNIGGLSTTWGGDLTDLHVWVYKRTTSIGFLCSSTKWNSISQLSSSTQQCPGNYECTNIIEDGNDFLVDTCVFCNEWTRNVKPMRLARKKRKREATKT